MTSIFNPACKAWFSVAEANTVKVAGETEMTADSFAYFFSVLARPCRIESFLSWNAVAYTIMRVVCPSYGNNRIKHSYGLRKKSRGFIPGLTRLLSRCRTA
ncbi:hypothetical protein V1282_001213 [Nitrobacteraceae bacterium AZCC 2146]